MRPPLAIPRFTPHIALYCLMLALLAGCNGMIHIPHSYPDGYGHYGEHYGSVPHGHKPPPGECRIWYPDRPAGHQPPPQSCHGIQHRVPPGAQIIYGG